MAFYTRVPLVIAALIVPTFYAHMDTGKWIACGAAIALVVLIAVWVSVFSWKKPENLLYGAETHFAKWRYEYHSDAEKAPASWKHGLQPQQVATAPVHAHTSIPENG